MSSSNNNLLSSEKCYLCQSFRLSWCKYHPATALITIHFFWLVLSACTRYRWPFLSLCLCASILFHCFSCIKSGYYLPQSLHLPILPSAEAWPENAFWSFLHLPIIVIFVTFVQNAYGSRHRLREREREREIHAKLYAHVHIFARKSFCRHRLYCQMHILLSAYVIVNLLNFSDNNNNNNKDNDVYTDNQ